MRQEHRADSPSNGIKGLGSILLNGIIWDKTWKYVNSRDLVENDNAIERSWNKNIKKV